MTDNSLKFKQAHMIRFKKIENVGYLEREVFPIFANILDEGDDKYIAVMEDKNKEDVIVLFLESTVINRIVSICQYKNLIKEEIDITERLIIGSEDKIVSMMRNSDEYKELFDSFFIRNLTSDMILDRMNILGSYDPTDLERLILANNV